VTDFNNQIIAPKEPRWVGNLRANPDVRIEAGTETIPVTARELHGDEWQIAWDAYTHRMAAFGDPAGVD
jgi:deazaflavin-dependent oxidoreductase (nitroreductase family)